MRVVDAVVITAAGTTVYECVLSSRQKTNLGMESKLVYGSGGTTIKVFLQTSYDGGQTWRDVICQAFTTASAQKAAGVSTEVASAATTAATDGTQTDDTINQGLLGPRFRVKVITAGTYAGGTTLTVSVEPRDK